MRPGRRARGWALLAGLAVVLAYLAGASVSGGRGPLARRPLLDGLAPPPPYHWVKPPPELAAQNKPPAATEAVVPLGASGSEVSAISTGDGQASLVLEANSIPPSKGATQVAVSIEPVDPATLAPAPPGLVLAGNAYRIGFTYRPSKAPAKLTGRATVVLVFPLLSIPVGSLFDYTLLASADGKAWTRQASSVTPGSHQVGAVLPEPGYVVVAVPPAPAASSKPNRLPLIAGLAGAGAVIAIGAVMLARRMRRSADYADDDEDYGDDEDGGEVDRPDPGRGSEERR